MDQARLREYESKCVQEEPPFCQAACPLHVDGRAVCVETKEGRTGEALKTLLRVLPLPHVLTRLCEEPCKAACKRKDLGGSIEMRAIERHCVEHGEPPKPPFMPAGGKKIAAVGSGLSSLVAAWDLARKGHLVTVFHGAAVGAELAALIPEDLNMEIDALKKMKVSFSQIGPAENFIEGLREKFDRVYVGLDDPCIELLGFQRAQGPLAEFFDYGVPHIFFDGQAASYIERAFQGRRAALSIIRDLQGASLSANREREGAFETRLFTNTEGATPVPPSADPVSEAARCLDCQCMECVKACEYLRAYKGYPKRYAREIYNNLSVVQGTRTANKMINSCTSCGLCASVCPNGFDMGKLCDEARTEMTRQGRMPPSAHEFALLDMENSSGNSFILPGQDGAPLFFPGCQLWASDPELVKRVYAFLRDRLGAGLWLDCCGAPAKWAGREDLFEEQKRALLSKGRLGTLIAGCSSCMAVFRQNLPDVQVVSLWEVLKDYGTPSHTLLKGLRPFRIPLTLYTPCSMRDGEELTSLLSLAAAAGIKIDGRRNGECCGYGGLQACANPGLADDTTRHIADEIGSDVLTACSMCRDRFASVGKRAAHLLDLLFPAEADPFSRTAPRLSERRENRERLRRELLNEKGARPMEYDFTLEFEPGVKEKLDKRRILDEDILRVVRRAEDTDRKMISPEGWNVACFKPRNVTTWVEYTVEKRPGRAACRIRNAWSHRMVVAGSQESEA